MISMKFAELHTPLFLAKKNLGTRLDREKHGMHSLKLVYDRAEKELLVTWNDETAIIPTTNVVSMIEGTPLAHLNAVQAPKGKIEAQVATPQMHVFAGEGHGKTGKDK